MLALRFFSGCGAEKASPGPSRSRFKIPIFGKPIGLQGTFSVWKDAASLRDFAYKGKAHSEAIKATSAQQWYSEELFARFAVIEERGMLI